MGKKEIGVKPDLGSPYSKVNLPEMKGNERKRHQQSIEECTKTGENV